MVNGAGDVSSLFATNEATARPFSVILGWHDESHDSPDYVEFRWWGPATDEWNALTLARHQAADDGLNPENRSETISFRVVAQRGFLPIAIEGRIRGHRPEALVID